MSEVLIFHGNANAPLAQEIAKFLGFKIGSATVGKFSDGETTVEIHDNVRGKEIFIIQPTCMPANDHLMELLCLADALRRASATKITAVMPYFGYARQDRRVRSARVPISAKVVANALEAVGINRLLTVDLHADQIQGFFYDPVDNIYSTPIMLEDILRQQYTNIRVVSPDIGGVVRARAIAKSLGTDNLAIIDKRRPEPGQSQVMNVIGDVAGNDCIIIDDIVDTAGTLCKAAEALLEKGANKVLAYVTHPVLSGKAIENIENSPLESLIVTNTIPLSAEAKHCKKIRVLSISELLAKTIRRISDQESVSSMFE